MGAKYNLNRGKTAIIDINVSEFADNIIIFPSEVDGHKITDIGISERSLHELNETFKEFNVIIEDGIKRMGNDMFLKSNISSIVIPPSMEAIPYRCFFESKLKKIVFKEKSSLKIIGESAFSDCYHLNSIFLPPSIELIEDKAFWSSRLTNITFPKANIAFGRAVFKYCDALKEVDMQNVTTDFISEGMFFDCAALEKITIPKTVSCIGESAFSGCRFLKTVGLSKTRVSKIFDGAFENCRSYSDGIFPDSIKEIGNEAFINCNINGLHLPLLTLNEVGNKAFCNNPLTNGVDLLPFMYCSTVGDYIFEGCRFESVHLLPFLGENASCKFMFSSCQNLKEVEMVKGSNLYRGMFRDCSKLEQITLPDDLTDIPDYAFQNTESLKSIVFPNFLKTIGYGAFFHSGFEKIDLSYLSSITIQSYAFDCPMLRSVRIPDYGCEIYSDSFDEQIVDLIKEQLPFVTIIK